MRDKYKPEAKKTPSLERESIAEQARSILSGEESWKPRVQWEDDGEAQEVETDITMPKDLK